MEPKKAEAMAPQEKNRICIRIDNGLLARFQIESAQSAHRIAYQTLINKSVAPVH